MITISDFSGRDVGAEGGGKGVGTEGKASPREVSEAFTVNDEVGGGSGCEGSATNG